MADRDITMHQVGSYNPNARESTTIINNNGGPTRLSSYFRQLHEEVKNKTTRDIIEELLEYKTKLDGTKGMEEKLKDGGFSDTFIRSALRKKQQYAKKAMQFDCYPSAQEINLLIFIDIMDLFTIYVEPLIKRCEPVETVMQCIHENVGYNQPTHVGGYYLGTGMDFSKVPLVSAQEEVKGDADGDGQLTLADVKAVVTLYASGAETWPAAADLDQDGRLTISDVTALMDLYRNAENKY